MGATKRLAERIVEAHAADSTTKFCAVRFGNVLGSRGSVVPTFSRQILSGGPVTLTHKDVTRFFMTIPEAASLIIEAACQADGGEIFILDMGEPVSIAELAHKMIRLHGLRPGTDIEVREVGLRPGEKLHEALTNTTETMVATQHARVFRILDSSRLPLQRGDVGKLAADLLTFAERGEPSRLVQTLFGAVRESVATLPTGTVETGVGGECGAKDPSTLQFGAWPETSVG
jgi:FlaA1/EpsC-like NDP-sugar epimerase